jgi:sugar lactone lactonase YvrE
MKPWWCLGLVALLLGCPTPTTRTASGALTVQVGALGRTVVADPAAEAAVYRIVLYQGTTLVDQVDLGPTTGSHTFSGLVSGTYTLSAAAYRSATTLDASTQIGAGSTEPFVFDATTASTVDVELATTQTGQGAVSLAFQLPASVGSQAVAYELRSLAGTVVRSGTVTAGVTGSWATGSLLESQVTSGLYLLFLTFHEGADVSGAVLGRYAEAVTVWDNLTSSRWVDGSGNLVAVRTYQASDFGSSNAQLSDLFVGPSGGTNLVTFDSSSTSFTAATTEAALVLDATTSVDGQRIRWSTDGGATYADLEGPTALPWGPLTQGLDLKVEVTAPDRSTVRTTSVTLARLYTLTYDGNGATGGTPPAAVGAPWTTTVAVAANPGTLTKGTSVFGGWNTKADGTGVSYSTGALWTADADQTLYAQWGTVTASYEWKYHTLGFAASSVPLVVGTGVTFSGTFTGAQTWAWYLDGNAVGTGTTYTFTPTSSQTGSHVVSLVVKTSSGFTASASVKVTVKAGLTVTTVTSLGFTARGLAAGTDGTVYLSDNSGNTIKRYASGTLTTFAGSGLPGTTDGTGTSASFSQPYGLALDAQGRLFVADAASGRIRVVTPTGTVTTVFDNAGSVLSSPSGLAVSSDGATIYVADRLHNRIVQLVWDGTNPAVATVLAGSGAQGAVDGAASSAQFNYPDSVALDSSGTTLYVGDNNSGLVRKITLSGTVTVSTLASIGQYVYGVAVDQSQTVYACTLDANNEITQITPAGVASVLAGGPAAGAADGPTSSATLNSPIELAWVAGTLYFIERGSQNLRKIE